MPVLQAQPVHLLVGVTACTATWDKTACTHLWCVLQLEMILQAQEYEAEQDIDLQDFFDSTKGRFTTPLGQSWAKEIVKRRADKQDAAHAKTNRGSSAVTKQIQ